MKFKTWRGEDLKGNYHFTIKVDGVRVHYRDGTPYSRANKIFPGLPHGILEDGTYEFFVEDIGNTVSIAMSKDPDHIFTTDQFYMLEPQLDERLYLATVVNPLEDVIRQVMEGRIAEGWEGLVLREHLTTKYIKVKPVETFDVRINSVEGGKRGKQYEDMLGAFRTERGKVGIGFTRDQRREFYNHGVIGQMIEVVAMGLTKKGQMRHARFIRFRPDLD